MKSFYTNNVIVLWRDCLQVFSVRFYDLMTLKPLVKSFINPSNVVLAIILTYLGINNIENLVGNIAE